MKSEEPMTIFPNGHIDKHLVICYNYLLNEG